MNSLQHQNAAAFDQVQPIGPGETWTIRHVGNAFYLVTSPVELQLRAGDTAEKAYRQGTGERFPGSMAFDRLEVRNPTSSTVWVRIWVGYGEYIDNRHQVVDQPCELAAVPLAGGLLAGGQDVFLSGASVGLRQQRRALVVSNLDAALRLEVLDAAGNVALLVHPGTSITLPVATAVSVRNPTGQSIQTAISEVWYLAQ